MLYLEEKGKDRVRMPECDRDIVIISMLMSPVEGSSLYEDDKLLITIVSKNWNTGALTLFMCIPLLPEIARALPLGSEIYFKDCGYRVSKKHPDELEAAIEDLHEIEQINEQGFDSEASARKADTAVVLASVVIVCVVLFVLAKIIWG